MKLFFLIFFFFFSFSFLNSEIKNLTNYSFDSIEPQNSPDKYSWNSLYLSKYFSLYISNEYNYSNVNKYNILKFCIGKTILYKNINSSFIDSFKIENVDKGNIIYKYSEKSLGDGPSFFSTFQGTFLLNDEDILFWDESLIYGLYSDTPSFFKSIINFHVINHDVYKITYSFFDMLINPYFTIEIYDKTVNSFKILFDQYRTPRIKSPKYGPPRIFYKFTDNLAFHTVNNINVRIRALPSQDSNVLGLIDHGDLFQIIDIYPIIFTNNNKNNYWIKIKYNKIIGYIFGEYLQLTDE